MQQQGQGRQNRGFKDDPNRLKYPSLNIYFSPRVHQQRIDHRSIPMCAYTNKIESTNISKIYDQPCPDTNDLRELTMEDGLIYQLKQMNREIRPEPQINGRPQRSPKPLKIKVLMCVCMYNESKNAINLTLNGIYQNLEKMEEEGIASEEIAVVMMQDGILKLVDDRNKRTMAKGKNSMVQFFRRLDQLDGKPKCELQERINIIIDEIDNYNRRGMQSYVAQNRDLPSSIEKNISLLYQNLWHPGMTDPQKDKLARQRQRPYTKYLKLFSCFKHLNGTKLSSHLWFFQGFCRYLDPEFIVLLDVGTKPQDSGVVNLIRGFNHPDVGGVTGLMSVDSNFPSEEGTGEAEASNNCLINFFFSIEKAQEYEYIIAHFIDKNQEGALGFLHVLPGAWSAYKYKALIKSQEYEPNLLQHSYFKMILNPQLEEKDFREANMYLAEDRILSLGIYCQTKQKYILRYVPDAIAKTDPMKTHQDLMKQRRRWINSSLFAFLYVYKNYYFHAMESKHNFFDKYVKLNLSMFLALLSLLSSYITPSIYFYVLLQTITQIDITSNSAAIAAKIVAIAYVMVYLVAVAGGLTGAVWTKHAYLVSAVLSCFTFAMLALVLYNLVFVYLGFTTTGIDFNSFTQVIILIMIIVNIGLYYFLILMHLPTHPTFVWRLFVDQFSYLTFQGAYSQTMVSHAFCNVDDVSWGTKGSTGSHGGKKYETQKVFFVSTWLFYNALLSYIYIYIDIVIPQNDTGPDGNRKYVLIAIAIYSTLQLFVKGMLAVYHHFKWVLTDCRCLTGMKYPGRPDLVRTLWRQLDKDYREKTKNRVFQ